MIRALHELGGMPLLTSDWDQDRFNYNKILANITRDYSDSSIFRIYVEVDTRNISDNIIHVSLKYCFTE